MGCLGWCLEGVQNPFSSAGVSSSEAQFLLSFLFSTFSNSCLLLCDTSRLPRSFFHFFPDKACCLASKSLEFTCPKFVLLCSMGRLTDLIYLSSYIFCVVINKGE